MRTLNILTFLISFSSFSQSIQKVDLKKVEILNSTALALLDNSAAIISSNPDVKEFNINTESLESISFDGNLFSSNMRGLEYYGLGTKTKEIKSFTMQKMQMPSVSGAYSKNDSIAKVAVGIKFNVFTLYNASSEDMREKYASMRQKLKKLIALANDQMEREGYKIGEDEDEAKKYNARFEEVLEELIKNESGIEAKNFSDILKAPLLTLDIASAYSMLMPAKDFNKSQSGRFGAWSTLTFTLGKGDEHLKLYGFCRYIQDNTDYDSKSKKFTNQTNFFDIGSKAQFDWNKISVGYEYIKRNGDGKNYRSVGFVQYKVSDNLYVTGGFGKNFESALNDETVSLLGIRWGINAKDSRNWE
ncbi:hypothetical protein [Flavobacterium sp. UGB4466]|uniref:hypothetical protein n=1 Tax=Flavobacterium sp. UGB4466 TaxID=2730889 RepID=UPI00192AE114|nr:hypothetical protein [Flavobacterium sp. UGB4466]